MTIIFWEHHHQPLDYFHYRCRWPKFEGLFNDFIGPGVLSAGQLYQAELRLLLFRRLQLQQPLNGSKQFVNRPFSDNHLLPEQFRATGLSLSWSSLFYRQHCRLNICCYIETFLSGSCLSCLFPLSWAWGSVLGVSVSFYFQNLHCNLLLALLRHNFTVSVPLLVVSPQAAVIKCVSSNYCIRA